jgi:pyrroline-5-carboxylate reductase
VNGASEGTRLIGLVGAGSMARALARGWGEPIVCTDAGSGKAEELVAEVGGRTAPDNGALAEEADFVVLCHKPAQLEEVAAQVDGRAREVVSILSGVTLASLRAAYPRSPLLRFVVNLPVEVRTGVVCHVGASGVDQRREAEIVGRFGRLGMLLRLEERLVPPVIGVSGVGPAYLALVVEAQIGAATRHGLPGEQAARLAVQTMAGTAALLRRRGLDPQGLRRSVASPGGPTEAGLAVLEEAGLRGAFLDAMDSVVEAVGRSPG